MVLVADRVQAGLARCAAVGVAGAREAVRDWQVRAARL